MATLAPKTGDRFRTRPKPAERPYIHVKLVDGRRVARGSVRCLLGHKIMRTNGRRPDGLYVEWCYDGREVVARTDPFGAFPLFYWLGDNEVLLSPSLGALIEQGAPTTLDPVALAVFFRLGFFLGDDTPFKEIRVLPPGGELRWNGRAHLSGGPWFGAPLEVSHMQAIDGFIKVLRNAVKLRLPDSKPWIMPLSGGRDSRLILLELVRLGCRPAFAVTTHRYPPHVSTDTQVAGQLCERLGIEHREIDPLGLPRVACEYRHIQESNFLADEGAWMYLLADLIRSAARVSYDGVGIDWLADPVFSEYGHKIDLYQGGDIRQTAQLLVSTSRIEGAAALFPDQCRGVRRDDVVDRVEEELSRYQRAACPWSSFWFWNRSRRELAQPAAILSLDLDAVYCPGLDSELYEFMSGLPLHRWRDDRFRETALERAHPEFSDLPFASFRKGRWLGHFAGFAMGICRRVLTRDPRWLVRKCGLLPKLARALADADFRKSEFWLAPQRLLYAFLLDQLRAGRGR